MIDTIVFRIHNLELHEPLCKFLNDKVKNSGMTISEVEPEKEFSELQKRVLKQFLVFHDTGNVLERAHFNKLKSSHYEISYQIDYLRDCINLNVSIPKYFFGTNVLLFNTPPTSKKFVFSSHNSLRKNLEESYAMLHYFFDKFFSTEFGSIQIYRSFVEINRIDICYNQVFHTKQDALEYLKQLKKVKKKFSRESSNHGNFKTTMMYKTDRYSFKCYHKGTEFKKNDRKKLQKQDLGILLYWNLRLIFLLF